MVSFDDPSPTTGPPCCRTTLFGSVVASLSPAPDVLPLAPDPDVVALRLEGLRFKVLE